MNFTHKHFTPPHLIFTLLLALSVFTGCQVESDDEPEKKTFTVTFNANGGSGEMKPQSAEEGTEITLTANAFTRDGFTFSGWNTVADGKGTDHADKSTIKLTENLTLYAQWTEIGKVEKVMFSATDDVDYNEKITLTCGTDGATIYYAVVAGTNVPTAEEFLSSKQKYSEPITITENAVVVAVAVKDGMKDSETATATFTVKTYTVTFETEHGTAPAKIEGLRKGDKLGDRLPELTAEGYKFDGWFNGETQFTTETEISSNLTLTAKWLKTYTITFDANGGAGTIASITEVAGTEITLPENTFARDGYIFAGWATSADGDVSYSDKAKITVTGNITLYAKWVVTVDSVSEVIKNIPADGNVHTVSLAGEISEDIITAIRKALITKPDIKVNLDLSSTTGLTEIPEYAFFDEGTGCEALAGIVLPQGIESIGENAFRQCSNLTYIVIPDSVKTVGSYAFSKCSSLSTLTIEDGVETIGEQAFSNCFALKEVTIPASVTLIEDYAFDCKSLANVYYGGTVAEWNAFKDSGKISSTNNDALVNATIYCADGIAITATKVAKLITILLSGEYNIAVSGAITGDTISAIATALKSNGNAKVILDLGGTTGLTEIPEDFMSNQDENLAGLVIPASVTEIKSNFWSCSNLSILKVAENNPAYKSVDNIIYSKDGQTLVLAAKAITDATIPASVVTIGTGAFQTCEKLQKVTFEQGSVLETIEDYAFIDCNELTEITLPSTLRTLGEYAFNCCFELKSITLPEGIKTIPAGAFINCRSLTEISLPSTLETIETWTFANTKLSIVKYNGTMTEWKAFVADAEKVGTSNDVLLNATIYCADGIAITATKVAKLITILLSGEYNIAVSGAITGDTISAIATALKSNGNAKVILDLSKTTGLTSIGENAFSDCSNLTSVNIPDSVTSIGNSAFSLCRSLTSISIPDGVTSIDAQTFYNCRSLTSVTIPAGVTSIGKSAFYGCDKLTTVNYKETEEQWSAISIGDYNDPLKNATANYNYTGE